MKKIVYALSLASLFSIYSCGGKNEPSNSTANAQPPEAAKKEVPVVHEKTEPAPAASPASNVMVGTWEGTMNEKHLTIVIESVNGTRLEGYNILGSNKRLLRGTFADGSWDQPCSKAFEATLAEPGDDKWDGVFTVKFIGYEDQKETSSGLECGGNLKGTEAQGEWKSNNGKMSHTFELVKNK